MKKLTTWISKLCFIWRKKEEITTPVLEKEEKKKSFFLYIEQVEQVLTWYRRTAKIARKDLELFLIDNEEEAAWQILKIIQMILPEVKMLYLKTSRPEFFLELAEQLFEEQGFLFILLDIDENVSYGNLVLDLRDWEKHLDIISEVSYNTLII